VPVLALHKPPGHGVWLYPQLFRLMRAWRPAIVHSRNLAALEAVVPAWAAGVPIRIHGEHGRDVDDLDGSNRKYRRLRRLYRPFVSHYVSLTTELTHYLATHIGVDPSRLTQICNGVDVGRFRPAERPAATIDGCPFDASRHWLVGTVGRMQAVKDQVTLARAFALALQERPALRERVRLVMIGDGPLRAQSQAVLDEAEWPNSPGSRASAAMCRGHARIKLLRPAFAGRRRVEHDPRGRWPAGCR
jgi:sugar transferase (PEP-CTERM/EpsH1 system associated)